jgi:hypothetical protein
MGVSVNGGGKIIMACWIQLYRRREEDSALEVGKELSYILFVPLFPVKRKNRI